MARFHLWIDRLIDAYTKGELYALSVAAPIDTANSLAIIPGTHDHASSRSHDAPAADVACDRCIGIRNSHLGAEQGHV